MREAKGAADAGGAHGPARGEPGLRDPGAPREERRDAEDELRRLATFRPAPFRPAWWLRGAHAQTLGGRHLRGGGGSLRESEIPTPDGDTLHLSHTTGDGEAGHSPRVVVLALHGLEGSATSGYMHALYDELRPYGIAAVGMDFRTCGGRTNRLPRFYHAGETEDLRTALAHVREAYPAATVAAAGFSLGANVLLKYLGEEGDLARSVLGAAVAVSVPFDLHAGGDALESGFARAYAGHFLRSLRGKLEGKRELVADACDVERGLAARTLREFDDAVTAPLHGFGGVDRYYAESSSARYVGAIRVPTLVLHAEDDPFLPASAIPRETLAENPWVRSAIVPRGGHVGFVEGRVPFAPRWWAEREAARFLAHILS